MTVKEFKDERHMRAQLLQETGEHSVRIQMLNKKIDEMEWDENPDRYDALVRLRDRALSDASRRIARMSFPEVARLSRYYAM